MAHDVRSPILSQQLLLSVAEQIKLPLMQLARQAELGQLSGQADLKTMQSTADMAINLIDNYIMGVRLTLHPEELNTESVSVASVLYDAGQQLDTLAKNYGVSLDINIAGRYGPVQAHREGLQAALVSLGAALIEAIPGQEGTQLRLHLATHRSRYGIVAGIYADTKQLSREVLSRGRRLQHSRQPLLNLSHTSAAGVFVADSILNAMQLHLTTSRHHRLYGLGTVLQPNKQLQLV